MDRSRTKLVCTIGPATADRVGELVAAGMDVARINFSHGTHEEHAKTVSLVRAAAAERGRPIAILGDLQGPRIRIGELKQPIPLTEGGDVADEGAQDGLSAAGAELGAGSVGEGCG